MGDEDRSVSSGDEMFGVSMNRNGHAVAKCRKGSDTFALQKIAKGSRAWSVLGEREMTFDGVLPGQ